MQEIIELLKLCLAELKVKNQVTSSSGKTNEELERERLDIKEISLRASRIEAEDNLKRALEKAKK